MRSYIGLNSAAQLLLTASDNPARLRSEASFVALCDVSPGPASSDKATRLRLNRGGDGAVNSALHIIAIGKLRLDPSTKEYVARRRAQRNQLRQMIHRTRSLQYHRASPKADQSGSNHRLTLRRAAWEASSLGQLPQLQVASEIKVSIPRDVC